jgi:hypothetical protein
MPLRNEISEYLDEMEEDWERFFNNFEPPEDWLGLSGVLFELFSSLYCRKCFVRNQ